MRQENVDEGAYSLPACMQGRRISSCQVYDERERSTHTVTPNRQSSDKYSSSHGVPKSGLPEQKIWQDDGGLNCYQLLS